MCILMFLCVFGLYVATFICLLALMFLMSSRVGLYVCLLFSGTRGVFAVEISLLSLDLHLETFQSALVLGSVIF